MIRILTIFLGSVIILYSCATPKFTFREMLNTTIPKKLKQILVIGIGSTTSRIFLENLNSNLTKKLKSSGIQSEYQYLGNNNEVAKENFKALKKDGFDAILIFSPENASFFEISTDRQLSSINTSEGSLPYYSNSTSITYQQNFFITLYLFDDMNRDLFKNKHTAIWDSKLTLDFNLTKKSVYKSITDKIIDRLIDNNYIQ